MVSIGWSATNLGFTLYAIFIQNQVLMGSTLNVFNTKKTRQAAFDP